MSWTMVKNTGWASVGVPIKPIYVFTKLQLLVPGETAAPGTVSGKTGTPTARTAGVVFTVTVNAVDAGWNVVSSTDTVGITSSDGSASLPVNAALSSGTKTFNVTLNTVGTATVTASDITDTNKTANTSPSITVNLGCAPVSDPSYVSANGQSGQATVYWASSNPVLILRKTAAFAGEKPTDGTTYTAGNTGGSLGTGVVQFVGSATELLQTSLANATTYYYKVFSNAASCYSPGIAIDTTPAAPVATQWSYATTAASMAPPGLDPWSNVVVSGSNDDYFHSMADANGTPASGFAPFPTGGPIQSRPSILPAGYRTPAGSGVNIAYVSSQDGFLYAVNSATGAQVWKSAALGTTLQGGAGVWIQALKPLTFAGGVTSDVVFVGTSNTGTGSTTNNSVYALNGATGAIVWTFTP